jgi:type I restriction enzyme S subunit
MQYALNSERIRNFDVPLPPLSEQRRIVAEVERRLSVAAEVESVLAACVARASRLRQAVLKSAFEGALVT